MASIDRLCVVCSKKNSAYKCPRCVNFYCSVACCHQHKTENSRCSASSQPPLKNCGLNIPETKSSQEFPTEDTVPFEKLKLLGENEGLKSLVRNSAHLQNLLTTIDRSTDPSSLLQRALKQDEEFQRFSAICLKTISERGSKDKREDDNARLAHLLTLAEDARDNPCVSTRQNATLTFLSLLNEDAINDDRDYETSMFAGGK